MTFLKGALGVVPLLVVPVGANANVGIPGPLIHYGASGSVDPLLWIVVTMVMCVTVEALVFRYSGQYRRPFLASLFVNVVSLLAGLPLGLLGAIDPTWFVLPTIASIFVELFVIRVSAKWSERAQGSIKSSPVFWANVLTNIILLGLLYVAFKKQ